MIEKEGELTVHSESVSMLIFTLVLDTTFSGDPDVPCSFGSLIQLHILAGKVDLLWKHLGICPFAPTAVKDLANANTAAKHRRSATRAVGRIETAISGGNLSSASQGNDTTLAPPLPSRPSSRSSSVSSVPSVTVNIPFHGEAAPRLMPSAMLSKFHADLCWLMVSGIVSWRVIEHPFWRHFFC